jgi:hypothetical protein
MDKRRYDFARINCNKLGVFRELEKKVFAKLELLNDDKAKESAI